MKTTLSLLKAGKSVIYKEENFLKGKYAVDKKGIEINCLSELACKFCTIGALMSVSRDPSQDEYKSAYRALTRVMGPVSEFSDNHTHAEVLAKWDEAIFNEQIKENNL